MEWVRNAQKFTIGPRFAHASCAVDKTIFIVGGQKKNYLDDLWAWDCAGDEWVGYSPAGRVPAPRVQSTAVFTGKELLLFGGYVENVAEENDLHALDVLNAEREYTWTQPEAVGAKPPKRYGHSATMVDGRMVVIAGQDSSAQLSDVWVLEAATYAWSRLEPGGDAFLPRALHSASHVPGHGLVVLGGFNRTARNLNQALVLELGANGTAAAWRECAGADALDMFKGRAQHRAVVQASHLIVFGGYNGQRPLNDLVVFDCATRAFLAAEQRGAPPEPRCRHTLELVGATLYCMLGYRADTAVGPDIFSLHVGSSSEGIERILGAGADAGAGANGDRGEQEAGAGGRDEGVGGE